MYMKLWMGAMLLMLGVMPTAAAAQPSGSSTVPSSVAPSEAQKIMSTYDTSRDGVLDKGEFRDYIIAHTFGIHNQNGDDLIDQDEYTRAFLYCRRQGSAWPCDIEKTWERWYEDGEKSEQLTLVLLLKNNQLFKNAVDRATEVHWARAAAAAGSFDGTLRGQLEKKEYCRTVSHTSTSAAPALDLTRLALYLDNEGRRKQRASPETREDFLRHCPADAAPPLVRKSAYVLRYTVEKLEEVDLDGNLALSPAEFMALFRSLRDFQALVDPETGHVELLSLIAAATEVPTKHAWIGTLMENASNEQWDALAGGETTATMDDLRGAWADAESAARLKVTKVEEVFGLPYIPNRGILFKGKPEVTKAGKVVVDDRFVAVTGRVIKRFMEAGENAASASLSYSRQRLPTTDATAFSVNGALRLDFYHPALYPTFRLALGPEWEYGRIKKRTLSDRANDTATDVDVRRLFLLGQLDLAGGFGILDGHSLQLGPVYEVDEETDINRFAGIVEWEPLLTLGPIATGTWNPFAQGKVEIFLAPRAGLELGEITDAPESNTPDASYLKYGFEIGVRLWDRITTKYVLAQRNSLENLSRDFTYHEVTVEWALDPAKHYFVNGSYKRGRNSPSFDHREIIEVGLGVKF
jgi:hypothetical protein